MESLDTQDALQAQQQVTTVRPSQAAVRMTLPGPSLPLDSHPDNVRRFVATYMRSPKETPAQRSECNTKLPAQTASTAAPPEGATASVPPEPAATGLAALVNSEEMQKMLQEMGWMKPPATPQQSAAADASHVAKASESDQALSGTAIPKSPDQGLNGVAVTNGADKGPLNGVATTNGEDKGLKTTSSADGLTGPPVGTNQGLNGPPVAKTPGAENDSNGPSVAKTTVPADQRVSPPVTTTVAVPSVAGHPDKNKPLRIAPFPHQPAASATGQEMPPAEPLQNVKEEPKLDQRQTYSRRAAANLIQRLRDNPKRVEGYPALKKMTRACS